MSAHIIGDAADIPFGQGRAYVVDGRQIAVFRLRDGQVRALDATCPHQGGPLADGLIDDTIVVCPLHGRSYDLASGHESGDGPPACSHAATIDDDGTVRVILDRAK
jgi:nitrite reductase (NADH) small subunit